MAPNLHSSDTWEGLIIGLVVGVIVGLAWGESLRLWARAYTERPHMENEHATGSMITRFVAWIRGLTIESELLIIATVMMVALGIFQIINYTRMTGFISCQADYNQQSYDARQARVTATDKENNLLFKALGDALNRRPVSNKTQALNRKEFQAAVQAHKDRIDQTRIHPYPPDPEETCGNY